MGLSMALGQGWEECSLGVRRSQLRWVLLQAPPPVGVAHGGRGHQWAGHLRVPKGSARSQCVFKDEWALVSEGTPCSSSCRGKQVVFLPVVVGVGHWPAPDSCKVENSSVLISGFEKFELNNVCNLSYAPPVPSFWWCAEMLVFMYTSIQIILKAPNSIQIVLKAPDRFCVLS